MEKQMETQANKTEPQSGRFPQAVIWTAGVALTLFCAVGIAAVMGWIPNSMGGPADNAAMAPQSASTASAAKRKTPRTASSQPALKAPIAPVQVAAAASCAACGVIESVRAIDTKGESSGVGVVGGAVVGGLLGNQVGGGRGKDVMTVVGAVGGAMAGNEVEKRVKTTRSYDVTVRMSDGSSRVISEASQPSWRTGDKVKIVNGVIQSNA